MNGNTIFKIGVIGAGAHGERYLRHGSNDVLGMTPSALCRRNEQAGKKMAEKFSCRHLQDAHELIASPDVDGVIVCTPPSSHFEFARATLKTGKPLLLEKPITGTLAEAEELLCLVGDTPVMVGHTLRWNPVIKKVKELWPRLGKVHLIRLVQRLEPTKLTWQRNLAETVGGSVLLTGVHIFDLARHLSGAEFLSIDSRQDCILNPVVEDIFLARAHLDDGCWVSLEVSKYTQSRGCWLEAVGENGQILADYLHGGISLRLGSEEEKFDVSARVPTLPGILDEWMRAALENRPCSVTLSDGVASMRIIDACYQSARQQREVSL
ncbi:MAG: Gfo/Idh/MocA family oxidoreductase [bacterium]|nr:Gfo/Idh/MocA family oxidoreductase [bacterium]